MPRKGASQWDFGELFPQEATRRVYSVGELTARIKGVLEKQVGEAWVSGEISNLRAQASGHVYFTLKDASAQLACVLFRGATVPDRSALRDGQHVILHGEITVYEPRGQYQMIVRSVELQGIGALQAAFERLKQKLQAEGLFETDRKRPIPRFPERLALVTSPTGAAIRDVLHVLGRRHPGLEVYLVPCRVQGQGAEREMADAIARINRWSAARPSAGIDVILLTRGGGSLEDLWAFNEEVLARAIVASAIPVVSAVGHEIDFTISDFVADLRAATPSAAAELLTAAFVEARDWLTRQGTRLSRLAWVAVERRLERLGDLRGRLARAHPRRRLNEQWQRLDDALESLNRAAEDARQRHARRLSEAALRLAARHPRPALAGSY